MTVFFFFRCIFLTRFSKILTSSSARIRDTLLKTLTGTRRTSCCCWGGFLYVSPGTFVLFFWTLWEEELSGRGAQILCSIVFFFFLQDVWAAAVSFHSKKKVTIVCASEGALALHHLPVATAEKGKYGGQGFCLNKKSPPLWAKTTIGMIHAEIPSLTYIERK